MDELAQLAQRLKGLRDSLDLSIEEMAADCGVTPETLIKYESGEHDIPVSFLQRLASRNGVELTALLFGEEPKMNSYYVNRKGKGVKVERRAAYSYEDLASGFRQRNMIPFMVTISPDHTAGTVHTPNTHEGQEFNYVVEGELEITIGKKSTILRAGDSVMFDARMPHALRAIGDKDAKMIAIIN
ncbi:MAG: XRE family transcriptional regulator [Muribaculaceae bacterium]|nr:XRE family transcriptional regulator [Muribaculaceae bacterium]MDE6522776.1 XRE family transcriptional regulator [Muribaculaceae bacterium]